MNLAPTLPVLLAAAAALSIALGCSTFDPPNTPAEGSAQPQKVVLAAAPSGRLLLVAEGGRARLHDAKTGEVLAESQPIEGDIRHLLVSWNDERFVVTTWQDRLLSLEKQGSVLAVVVAIKANSSFISAPVFRPDGALAIARDGWIDVWPEANLFADPYSKRVAPGVRAIAYRPRDNALAAAFDDRVIVWDGLSGDLAESHPAPARGLVAYAGDDTLASGTSPLVLLEYGPKWVPRPEVTGCEQLVWSERTGDLACVGSESTWVCRKGRCEVVAPEPGASRILWAGAARDGFFFSSGDGRVTHRMSNGERWTVLIDGVFDSPRGPK